MKNQILGLLAIILLSGRISAQSVSRIDAGISPQTGKSQPSGTLDISSFGGYIGTVYGNGGTPATTCSVKRFTAVCASPSDFKNAHGILILGAGPVPAIPKPQAPTVTPIFQTGSTIRSYCVADRDWAGGITPCSSAGSTSTAPAMMVTANYSISNWSFNLSTHTFTVTTSIPHNMPTMSSGVASEPYSQINISGTGNNACNGAFSLTAVPSATTFQFTRNELTSDPGCSGGTMSILPRIILKWDSHATARVQSASCSAGVAKATISPGVYGPANTAAPNWVVPYYVTAVISGVADSHYNGTFQINNYTPGGATPNTVQYSIGSCTGVSNVGPGGTVSYVPSRAVKNHIIYGCTGSSCALPANASNYSIVGVAIGNDGYFVDKGWGWGANFAPYLDTGDAPTTAPLTATNEYLDTTITTISGATFTLAASATNEVTNAKVFHDNTPNLLAACAALPQSRGGQVGGHIVIPEPSSVYNYFPIIGNFDMNGTFGATVHNCPAGVTIELHASSFLMGSILPNGGNLIGYAGSTNCFPSFGMSADSACIQGSSYPLIYTGSFTYMQDLSIYGNGYYQSSLYFDEDTAGGGNVYNHFNKVYAAGNNRGYPVIDKTGFGRFWDYSGWVASNGSAAFSEARDYTVTLNCGMPIYLPAAPPLTYIWNANHTYSFGTFQVDTCGQSNTNWGPQINDMLTENSPGPVFKFNIFGRGLNGASFSYINNADPISGASTPIFDAVNTTIQGADFSNIGCATGYNPIFQTGTNPSYYYNMTVRQGQGVCSAGTGVLTGIANYTTTTNSGFSGTIWGGMQDFSNTLVFRPKFGLSANKPATCTLGDVYEATDATPGQNWYFCTVTGNPGTWTQQTGGGVASLTTTAATSDNVTIKGVTASSHCQISPTNASAATNYSTTYISAKKTNQVTISHTATSGMTYDIFCSAN